MGIIILILKIILILGVLVAIYFLISYCVFKFVQKYRNSNMTITAHSGCNGTELNSMASLEEGYNSGADILEFDLNFNKYGVPYLCHDELKGLEIKLEEAFIFLVNNQNVKANIDVKKTDNMPAVFQLINKYNLSNRVFFTGVKEEFVEAVRTGCPGIEYYLNYKPEFLKIHCQQYINELMNKVKDCSAVGINMRHYYLSGKLVKTFHEQNLLVSVWTVNDRYFMQRAIYYGADNITTKNPMKLKRLIGERNNIKKA